MPRPYSLTQGPNVTYVQMSALCAISLANKLILSVILANFSNTYLLHDILVQVLI